LEFLGRIDDQLKIRGTRVEPAETAAHLRTHPSVAQAAVIVRTLTVGAKALVGYVTPADPAVPPDVTVLRDHVRQSLPEAAVPAAIVVLDRIPLNVNGKLDRNALPEPRLEHGASADGADGGFQTELERTLAGVWAEVLGLGQVVRDDDFFAIGGNSMAMLRVSARIDEVCGLAVPLRLFFANPTVAKLAAALEGGEA
jgi:hypothetical protein